MYETQQDLGDLLDDLERALAVRISPCTGQI